MGWLPQVVLRNMEHLPFGDVIQKVSLTLFTDLNKLLNILKPLSPELRTIRLHTYVTDAKRKLQLLLLIKRWLSLPDTIPYFKSISKLSASLHALDNINNEVQDGLYFAHRDLFSMRVRSINVDLAYNIMGTRTYPSLPLSIFTQGRMPIPGHLYNSSDINEKQNNQDKLKHDLSLFIKAKIYLSDPIPLAFDVNHVTVQNGEICLTRPNLYLIILSLQYLHESSPWKIIKYKCLVQSLPSSTLSSSSSSQVIKQYESDVVRILTSLSQEEQAWQVMMSEENRLTKHISADQEISSNTNINMEAPTTSDTSNLSSSTAQLNLSRINYICTHATEAVILRHLYRQLQALKCEISSIVGSAIEIDFQDISLLSYLILRVHPSTLTGRFAYELQILLPHQKYDPSAATTQFVIRLVILDIVTIAPTTSVGSNNKSSIDHSITRGSSSNVGWTGIGSGSVASDMNSRGRLSDSGAGADAYDALIASYRDYSPEHITHCLPSINTLFDSTSFTTSLPTTYVDGVALYTSLSITLAQIKLKVLFARIVISLDWQRLRREYDLNLRLDCRTHTSTTNLNIYTSSTSRAARAIADDANDDPLVTISMKASTGQLICQYMYPQINSSNDISYGDLYNLFEGEINNIASTQYVNAYLSSDVIKGEVDGVCESYLSNTTSMEIEEVRTGHSAVYDTSYSNQEGHNYDRLVYLKPILTFSNIVTVAAFAQWTARQRMLLPYSLESYAEAYTSLLSTIQTSDNIHLLSGAGSVYLLESWPVYDVHGKQHLDTYESLFPMSLVSYSDFCGGNLSSDTDAAIGGRIGKDVVGGMPGGGKRKGVKRLFNENDEYLPKKRALAVNTSLDMPTSSSPPPVAANAVEATVATRRGLFLVLALGNSTGFPLYASAVVAAYRSDLTPPPTAISEHAQNPRQSINLLSPPLTQYKLPLTYSPLSDLALSDCITLAREWKSAHLAPNFIPPTYLLVQSHRRTETSTTSSTVESNIATVYIQLITATAFTLWSTNDKVPTSTYPESLSFACYFDPTRKIQQYLIQHTPSCPSPFIGAIIKLPLTIVESLIRPPPAYKGSLLLPTLTPDKAFNIIVAELSTSHPDFTPTDATISNDTHSCRTSPRIFVLKTQFLALASMLLQSSVNQYFKNYLATVPSSHPRGFSNVLEALHYIEGDMLNVRVLINFLVLVYTYNISLTPAPPGERTSSEKRTRLRYLHTDFSYPNTYPPSPQASVHHSALQHSGPSGCAASGLNPRILFAFETEVALNGVTADSIDSSNAPHNSSYCWMIDTFIAVTVEVIQGSSGGDKTTRLFFQEVNGIAAPPISTHAHVGATVGEADTSPLPAIDSGIQDRIDPQAITSVSAYVSLLKRFASIIEFSRSTV